MICTPKVRHFLRYISFCDTSVFLYNVGNDKPITLYAEFYLLI